VVEFTIKAHGLMTRVDKWKEPPLNGRFFYFGRRVTIEKAKVLLVRKGKRSVNE